MCIKKCMYCGSKPQIKKIEDLYYVQCPKCNKHDIYAYVGLKEQTSIERWNSANIPQLNTKPTTAKGKLHGIRYTYNIDGKICYRMAEISAKVGVSKKWLHMLFEKAPSNTIVVNGHTINRRKKGVWNDK